MSKEWMLKMLANLGLKGLDAEIYEYLVKNDPQTVKDIAEALETCKQHLYRSLKSLQLRGLISASQERPASFSAVSFERLIDSLIKANRETAHRIEQNKEQILATWRSKISGDSNVQKSLDEDPCH